MATATLVERPQRQSGGLNKPPEVTGEPSPNSGAVTQPVPETPDATPGQAALRRIGSLPGVRRGKVLNIRRQIAEGTYDVEDRLGRATDRVLRDVSAT
jgi:hypothetical protein